MTRLVQLTAVGLLSLLLAGCETDQGNVEKSIREEMKAKQGVAMKTFDLKKQADGGFSGTATAENGDVYDVAVQPPQGGLLQWQAVQGQAMIEKMVRDGLKEKGNDVKSFQLTKAAPGVYAGTAELATGAKWAVTTRMEGPELRWEARPADQ